jgi:hypothetical protein
MSQTDFHAALLSPDVGPPPGLTDAKGRPAGNRFDVYRNNVASSLTEVLEKGFPVLQKLLGEAYFKALALAFLRKNPPKTRIMMLYGAEMPGFLKAFPPLAHLPYLADIARLEQGLRESYHAADAAPLATEVLSALSLEALMAARFSIAPAVQVIASDYPVWSIWQANTRADAPRPVMQPEAAVILRPGFDPEPHLLPPGGAGFITALMEGQPLGDACNTAPDDFDLTACLGLLIGGGALISHQ